jgi:hypothetical protein
MGISSIAKTTAAVGLVAGLFAYAPTAQAQEPQERFLGTGYSESDAHQAAVEYMVKFEKENDQQCHQTSYFTFLTQDDPSTRLSGLWQYFLYASCAPVTESSAL